MSEKKIPQRMCVGCGLMKDKCSLLRIVRSSEGKAVPDPTGHLEGRGAYICNDERCFNKARKNRRIEKSFSLSLSDEAYNALYESFFGKDNK